VQTRLKSFIKEYSTTYLGNQLSCQYITYNPHEFYMSRLVTLWRHSILH
jgi:hypothetical protein